MADDALTVAKELTLAVLPKVDLGSNEPDDVGQATGKVFKTIIKQVVEGIEEANK